MPKIRRHLARMLGIGLAALLLGFSVQAQAGCGTIVTLNPTGHWVWITIYDVGERQQLDWGWLGPHGVREWHAGGAPTPQSYLCGSFYHVRYEVKGPGGPNPPGDVPNIFDTRMRIDPQLTQSDIIQLFASIGQGLMCVVPGAEAGCVEEWGIGEVAQAGALGVIGSNSNNSVVCIKPNGEGFYLENSGNCALRPRPLPPRKPPVDHYTFLPASRRMGVGIAKDAFAIAKNGKPIQDRSLYQKGRFYTEHPGIARFDNPKDGHIHGVKKGKTKAFWDFDNKRQATAEVEVD